MDRVVWNCPVSLEMYGRGHYRVVSSAKEAERVLRNEWPQLNGCSYDVALEMCYAALRADADPEQARLAFLAAAREADIPVVGET
ncbi:DUF982 domain-containing protein [Rhizobium wenxiniae]|uniref:DUF982 domain-containing protein n=1 Tax=Rhizobium wenxiniae TaxID=1737357 RepID=UPI001C6EE6E2|nr:DUF982 domain-containing protein [Rhizobium wenxiniae]MBW9091780.1 DUF982 domain-containing protein [Rhizobium wenxiniae]